MDEVDGMAGNEDRGGIPVSAICSELLLSIKHLSSQELIKLIKTSRIPIICICNDRQHTKIRSLANYCYDLRFQRPKVDQIKVSVWILCVTTAFHTCNHYLLGMLGCHDEGGIPRADQNHR